MKVSSIQQPIYGRPYLISIQSKSNTSCAAPVKNTPNVVFGGIPNSEQLRSLFAYGLPCMYSGVEMIDSSLTDKLIKSGVFSRPAKVAVAALAIFKDSFTNIEKQVFKKMQTRAKRYPEEDLQELMTAFSSQNMRRLRITQKDIFKELDALSENLPSKEKQAFDDLMKRTDDRLHERPVITTFNKFTFQYRLGKIKEDIDEIVGTKYGKIISEMIEESEYLSDIDREENREAQIAILNHLRSVMNSSATLRNYVPLNQLFERSIAKLNGEPVVISFSRKAFLSELKIVLDGVSDAELKETMFKTAEKLPTSKNAVDAYIVKYKDSPPDKIAFRLLHPSSASVEHIHPKSLGGADSMANFGGATISENTARGNMDFTEQMKKRPATPENCQKYLDKLIELERNGVFDKLGMDVSYIKDFVRAVKRESKGQIILDVSGLYM